MTAVFDPTINLGTIVSILVNVVLLGVPGIWWASKVTQILKDMRDDVVDLKTLSATKAEVGSVKAAIKAEHQHLEEQMKEVREDIRRAGPRRG